MSSSTRQPSPGPSSTLDESIPTFNAKKRARSEDVEDERHSKKRFEDADPDPATSAESIALHEKFYFPDSAGGLSVFKVDGTYYKVHRYMLERESSVFKAMFSSPSPSEGQDGESNEKPINIPDVSHSEFEALLDFLYNGSLFSGFELLFDSENVETSTSYLTVKQKTKLLTEAMTKIRRKISDDQAPILDLLSISLRFEFERITNLIVAVIGFLDKHLDCDSRYSVGGDLQAVKRIEMALRHDVLRHWLLPAFQSLVCRSAPLTADEGRRLGYHRMAIVAAAREKQLVSMSRIVSIPPEFLN